ncbi:MAG: hypothetical protein PHE03_08810 [Bacteroidales bacterium]|nr:hypothetical protein [Bacteroidales bacterium]MDD3892388.1 hypothetical protein [Bacteroidales bacterium]
MRTKYFIFLVLGLQFLNGFSQTDEVKTAKPAYLTFQTGFIVDGYNSIGIRTFFEYQKDLRENWQFGVSYEHSRHFGFFLTDQLYDLNSNLSQLSLNGYYKLNLIRDRLFWTVGIGAGALHVNWDNNDSFGATINASLTLNIRVTKRIYFESSPLIALAPFNRAYYSPMKIDHFNNFYAFTFFPFGLKVKL